MEQRITRKRQKNFVKDKAKSEPTKAFTKERFCPIILPKIDHSKSSK